jgi:DNA-binding transcriptional regulator YiaG
VTPRQFKKAIETLGLTQNGAARFLGVDDRTVRRWVSTDPDDQRGIPNPVANFLNFLIAAKITPDEVEAALKRR